MSSNHSWKLDSPDPILLGGCRRLASRLNLSVQGTRIAAGAALLLFSTAMCDGLASTLVLAGCIYAVLSLRFRRSKADICHVSEAPPSAHLDLIEQRMVRISRRLERLEAVVTKSSFDWDERFNRR